MTKNDCVGCIHYRPYSKHKGSNEWECEYGMSLACECIDDGYSKKEKFEEMMQKTSRNINVGYLSALFDTAIEYISKITIDERISKPIHKTINPMLDDMVGQLHSMKNNLMATMMFEGGERTKVIQPKEKESE